MINTQTLALTIIADAKSNATDEIKEIAIQSVIEEHMNDIIDRY